MNARVSIVLALLLPACAWAQSATELVQQLVAEAWAPKAVRVEWTFSAKAPADLERYHDWKLVEPHALRLAGNVILTFERHEQAATRRIVATGTARIFGNSLTVKQPIASGQPVEIKNLDSLEADWTHLNGDAAQISDFATAQVAARALTPGRTITTHDIKGEKLIHRGQTVEVQYADGAVRIRISGRALKDGAVGDLVPVSTDLVASKQLTGTVSKDGTIQLVR